MGSLHRCKDPDILKKNREPQRDLGRRLGRICICQTVSFLLSVRESLHFADLVSLAPFQYFCTLNYLVSCMYVTFVSSCVKICHCESLVGFPFVLHKTVHAQWEAPELLYGFFFLFLPGGFCRNSVFGGGGGGSALKLGHIAHN
jgi:hypothetical protein